MIDFIDLIDCIDVIDFLDAIILIEVIDTVVLIDVTQCFPQSCVPGEQQFVLVKVLYPFYNCRACEDVW